MTDHDRGESFGATCDYCREYFTARYADEYGTSKRCPECDRVYESVEFVTGTWTVRDADVRTTVVETLAANLPADLYVWREGRLPRLRLYRADEPVALGQPDALVDGAGGDD